MHLSYKQQSVAPLMPRQTSPRVKGSGEDPLVSSPASPLEMRAGGTWKGQLQISPSPLHWQALSRLQITWTCPPLCPPCLQHIPTCSQYTHSLLAALQGSQEQWMNRNWDCMIITTSSVSSVSQALLPKHWRSDSRGKAMNFLFPWPEGDFAWLNLYTLFLVTRATGTLQMLIIHKLIQLCSLLFLFSAA